MRIIVKRDQDSAEIAIDTKDCRYPYAIRDAISLALREEGYMDDTINEVFGIMPDCAKSPSEEHEADK